MSVTNNNLTNSDVLSLPGICMHYYQFICDYTALQKNNFEIHIDEYDNLLCFLAAESDSDIRFPPSRLDFVRFYVTIEI